MWPATEPEGSSPGAFTSSPFNQVTFGLTRLDANILLSGNFLIGISDLRGDGRPDYRYRAHVLYADSILPPRVSVNGGVVTLQGTGFVPGMSAALGLSPATPLAVTSTLMTLAVPAHADGPQSITVRDPVTGGATVMTGALTYGASASDSIILLNGANPSTPVGVQAANPMSVRVLASDGVTPVGGATVGWSGTNGVQLSACGGASSCSVITDQNGNAATWLTAAAPGASFVTATLAPGVYSPPKAVTGTLSATLSSSDIGVSVPTVYISQGATVSVPVSARVLGNGSPRSNVQVNFSIVSGSGSLSAVSATTDANGYAGVTLSVVNLTCLCRGLPAWPRRILPVLCFMPIRFRWLNSRFRARRRSLRDSRFNRSWCGWWIQRPLRIRCWQLPSLFLRPCCVLVEPRRVRAQEKQILAIRPCR